MEAGAVVDNINTVSLVGIYGSLIVLFRIGWENCVVWGCVAWSYGVYAVVIDSGCRSEYY